MQNRNSNIGGNIQRYNLVVFYKVKHILITGPNNFTSRCLPQINENMSTQGLAYER